jgi:HK97 family phage major capsid protein
MIFTTQERKLKDQMNGISDKMQNILDGAEKQNRDLTKKEQDDFDRLAMKHDQLSDKFQNEGQDMNGTFSKDTINKFFEGNNMKSTKQENSKWVDPKTGENIRVLGKNEKLSTGNSDFNIAKAIRAMVTGDYSSAESEARAMDLSGNIAVVPTPVSQRLVDKMRDKLVLNRLGMQTVPMTSSTLTFAKVDTDPVAKFRAEGAEINETSVGISGITLTAQSLAAGTSLTSELAEDSPNAEDVIMDTLAAVMAQKVDAAGLLGSGTAPIPQGIFGATGVTDTAVTAEPTYDDFSNLYYRLKAGNESPNGLVVSPRTMQGLDQLKNTNGDYLAPPQSWTQFAKEATNAVPNDGGINNDESLAIAGNFQQLFMGMRQNLKMEVSRQASTSTENAWSELKVFIRVHMRLDFAIGRPTAFQTLSEIL